jgi:TatD DNase family protein
VIHCFTGTQPFGEECLKLGFYISFSGILTFKSADELRASARAFPLERLLVETDSPFLAPIPFRGRKCEPSMVRQTAEKIAEVKGVSIEDVAKATCANARAVFRLP